MKKTAGYYKKQEVGERGGKAIIGHTNGYELVAVNDPERGTYIINCETGEETPHEFEDFENRSLVLSELYDYYNGSDAPAMNPNELRALRVICEDCDDLDGYGFTRIGDAVSALTAEFGNGQVAGGYLSSLITKGLIDFEEEEDEVWVEPDVFRRYCPA